MNISRIARIAHEIKQEVSTLTDFEAMQLAVKLYEIESYRDANVVGHTTAPTALESIAMNLQSIADAIGTLDLNFSDK